MLRLDPNGPRLNLPTVEQWNTAIKAEGFDLVIDPFDLREDDGYRPGLLRDEESGFEWFLGPVAEEYESLSRSELGSSNMEASISYASYADEEIAAVIAAAVLTKITDGYYVNNDQDGVLYRQDAALAIARKDYNDWQSRQT
jgi:hypothetical protein